MTPHTWNIIIPGAWNKAIFTPDRIRRDLFGHAQGTPIQLEVEVLNPGVFRVKNDEVSVCPTDQSIVFDPLEMTLEGMLKAREVAKKTLEYLPQTPLLAAGMNFRYRLDEAPAALLTSLKITLDDKFSDLQMLIVGRSIKRTFNHGGGYLNIEIATNGAGAEVTYNFHKDSPNSGELIQWLMECENAHEKALQLNDLLTQ